MDTAAREASRKLRDPKIRERLKELTGSAVAEQRELLSARLLDLLTRRAFYDTLDMVDDNGQLKKELARNRTYGILDAVNNTEANDKPAFSLKLASRDKAIELLIKLLQVQKIELREAERSPNVVLLSPMKLSFDEWGKKYGSANG